MPVTRTDSPFRSDGVTCAAWSYAGDAEQDVPVVVMAHGFAGTRGMRLDAYARRFAEAGYRVLLFDYRHFGDSDGQPRQLLDIRRQLADWRAAVEHARALTGVDPERVVLWGTSLAGGHVLTTAARDHRVAAVVAQVPHVSGVAASRSIGVGTSLRLGALGVLDVGRALLRRTPLYVRSIGSPGELAFMSSPDARPGLEVMIEQSDIDEPPQQVAARVVLQMGLYSPGRTVGRITAPTLVQIGTRDVITPTAVARRVAKRLPNGRAIEYDVAHFDPYVEPYFDRVVGDQLAFLRECCPVGVGSA